MTGSSGRPRLPGLQDVAELTGRSGVSNWETSDAVSLAPHIRWVTKPLPSVPHLYFCSGLFILTVATDPQAAIISPIVGETLVTPLVSSSPLFSLLSLLLLLPKRSFSTPRLLCLPLACLLRGT